MELPKSDVDDAAPNAGVAAAPNREPELAPNAGVDAAPNSDVELAPAAGVDAPPNSEGALCCWPKGVAGADVPAKLNAEELAAGVAKLKLDPAALLLAPPKLNAIVTKQLPE